MSTVVAIHWNSDSLQYVVARGGRVETYSTVAMPEGSGPVAIGKKLAEELSHQVSGRVKTIVALARNSLEWQHLALPPCPTDELPDLVRLQSDRELSATGEDDVGFDYLPLSGDEHNAYQVLTVAIATAQIERIRQVCREANLTVDRIVPLAAGWPALASQAGLIHRTESQVFVAPLASEATLWATRAHNAVLFRQFQYPSTDEHGTQAGAIGNELRRSLLSLSQNDGFANPQVTIIGSQASPAGELAQLLDAQVEPAVQAVNIDEQIKSLAGMANAPPPLFALAGLAFDEAAGHSPPVDLLNPRRRPKAAINYRTYALAGIAAALLLLTLGWGGYRNLNAPLEMAAEDRAALDLLEESSEELAEYERKATAVRKWLEESPNLLAHLQHLSRSVRPSELDADDFSFERDLVVEKFNLDKRRLVIDAVARNSRAVQPLEMRLRRANYSPERGKSGPSKKDDYPWKFQSIIEIDAESDQAASELAATEPAASDAGEPPAEATQATEETTPSEETPS